MKPGKPATFGSHREGLVFALPGNPLSALVTFSVLVAPALRTMLGLPRPRGIHVSAVLEESFQREASRTGFLPARTTWEGEDCTVRRIRIHGSADLASTTAINSLMICPREVEEFQAGTRLECLLLPEWPIS
jgi:molybdopterin molybdotransferase